MAIPKFGGRDCELSTTGIDAHGHTIDAWKVTREVLARVGPALESQGVRVWTRDVQSSRSSYGSGYVSAYSSDCLRHWTAGGQCYYSDMGHVECCTAATKYPRSFAAQCLSTLLVVEEARKLAQAEAADAATYALTTANADVLDPAISFGTHLSLTVSRSLWEDLIVEERHPAILGFVTSALAAAVPFFGAGYILPWNDGTAVYSLSARAHHLSKMRTLSTTEPFGRGLLNSRHEPHGNQHERLHLICFDFCVQSAALLFSFLQCVLAAAEEGYCGLNLYDPVRALRTWSWSTDLRTGKLPATAMLVDGRHLTLPAYLREVATVLLRMCEQGLITERIAPQATEMLPRVIELAHCAEAGDLLQCGKHLTWASKLLWLTQLCQQNGAGLPDAAIRLADHDFGHTAPEHGAFWQLWEQGLVDPLVSPAEVRACLAQGPAESRDWGRGRIIDRFYDHVSDVDWSYIDLRADDGRWSPRLRIELPQMDSLDRHRFQTLIDSATDPSQLSQCLAGQTGGQTRRSDPLDDVTRQLATVHYATAYSRRDSDA